jgi:hypothetical protein
MRSLDQILAHSGGGNLTPQEIEMVGEALRDGRASDEYTAMLVLGRAGAKQFEPEVAERLDSEDDPMLARLGGPGHL